MKQKTKIAICFFGYTGSLGRDNMGPSLDIKKISDNFHNYVAYDNNFDFDVYIHSWSVDQKENLINNYSPKDTLIEPPKFQLSEDSQELKKRRDDRPMGDTENNRNAIDESFYDPAMTFSRYYSQARSIELMKNSGIEYDIVMLSRLDLLWKTHCDFNLFFRVLSPHKFYTLGHPFSWATTDLLLISNMDNIIQFGELSDVTFTPKTFRKKSKWEWKHPNTHISCSSSWCDRYSGTLGNLKATGTTSHRIYEGLIRYITPDTIVDRKEHIPNWERLRQKNNGYWINTWTNDPSYQESRKDLNIRQIKAPAPVEIYMIGRDCAIARYSCRPKTDWKLP